MRHYIRFDPHFKDRKAAYTDGAYAALIDVLCYAEEQPERGRFKSRRLLNVLLGRRARWIPFLLERRDLVLQEDGRLYVDGWDEWQEGDVTVRERVQRIRRRRAVTDVTADVTVATVNTPSERQREAVSGKQDLITPPEAPPNSHRPRFAELVERVRQEGR